MSGPGQRTLWVVQGERQVERLALEGLSAETRTSLRARLTAALLPDAALVEPRECRLALSVALAEPDAAVPGQLALFGDRALAATGGDAGRDRGDALIDLVRARGGASWARLVAALDEALSLLRARGATAEHLERVSRSKGFLAARAGTLATAMRALDARLALAGAKDSRLVGTLLAKAIAATPGDELEVLVGAPCLRARWLLAWEPADVAWWRALDDALALRGGSARLVLPSFDRPLAGEREGDPLDALAEDLSRSLDGPTESESVTPALGFLTDAPGAVLPEPSRVRLVGASCAVGQARAVAAEVVAALARGAAVDRIAVTFAAADERTLGPLRRALEDAGIVFHEARGAPPSSAPVVGAAFLALEAMTSLDRVVVARLLRSGWVDAARLSCGEGRRDAERRLARLARRLEQSATASGLDAAERLLRTAASRPPVLRGPGRETADQEQERDAEVAAGLLAILTRHRHAATRGAQVGAARALWAELGIGALAGRGGLASFRSDAPPSGVPRAERLAIARDALAWDALVGALDVHESISSRVGALSQPLDGDGFRFELRELLDAAASRPGAGRAGAVRVSRLADVVGDELDHLIVFDANEGRLPRQAAPEALVSEALADALTRASRGAFVAPASGATRVRDLATLAVAASEAQLVTLVFAREDAANAPLAPSFVVEGLERAGLSVLAAEPGPPTRSGVDVQLRIDREREREGFFLDPARARTDVIGDLAPSAALAQVLLAETGGAGRPLAVTGLERFARCAFMGYAHVVLAAREADGVGELPDAREEGTLVHEVLAAAFVATRELWSRRPRPAEIILSRAAAAAELLLDRWQGHAKLRAVIRLRVGDAVRAVLAAALEDTTWDFTLAEQAFGGSSDDSWPSFAVVRDDVSVLLRGSMDRLDRRHDGLELRVVDYKRSQTTVTDAARTLGETALQVPLYACVASRQLHLPACGVYLPTRARDVASETGAANRAGPRMAELVARSGEDLAEIEQRALTIVSSVRAGALAPMPAEESACRLCAVSGGCRKPRFAMTPLEDVEHERDG